MAAPNSVGGGALISAAGSTSVSQNDLVLGVSGAVPNQFGIFFYGLEEAQLPFGDGFLCIASGGFGLFRFAPAIRADFIGDVSYAVDYDRPPASTCAGSVSPGATLNFQFWYRDPAGPGGSGFNLSNGLRAQFCP